MPQTNLTSPLDSGPGTEIWGRKDQAVHLSWATDLSPNPEALWPLLSDTSDLNARLGLPEMEFEERDGQLFGSLGSGLFRQEWMEVPWQWGSGKSLTGERHYSKGFAWAVRVRCLLAEHLGGTRLTVGIEWIPRHWWHRPLLRSINRGLRSKYLRVLRDLTTQLAARREGNIISHRTPAPKLMRSDCERACRNSLKAGSPNQKLSALLVTFALRQTRSSSASARRIWHATGIWSLGIFSQFFFRLRVQDCSEPPGT